MHHSFPSDLAALIALGGFAILFAVCTRGPRGRENAGTAIVFGIMLAVFVFVVWFFMNLKC